MSRFFDELEQRLRASAAEQHAPHPAPVPAPAGRARRGRSRSRLLAVAAVVALTGAAVPALSAVTGLWQPDVEPQAPWGTSTVEGTSFSCPSRSPRFRVGPPIGPEFAAAFAVFARPRTAADRFERKYLRALPLIGADVDGIRRVGTAADGEPYFLIPAQGLGRQPPPAACLRGLPAEQRRAYAAMRPRMEPSICAGDGCSTLGDLARHGSYGTSGTVRGRATVAGIVPNGVRAVTVTYGRSTRTFPVSGNFFTFLLGVDVEQASRPDRLVWRMDDGSERDVTR